MKPGDHGSTFAGNPLVCHAAQATFDILSDPEFLKAVSDKGEHLRSELRKAVGDRDEVTEVRGLGLICGIQLQPVSYNPHPTTYFCSLFPNKGFCSLNIELTKEPVMKNLTCNTLTKALGRNLSIMIIQWTSYH